MDDYGLLPHLEEGSYGVRGGGGLLRPQKSNLCPLLWIQNPPPKHNTESHFPSPSFGLVGVIALLLQPDSS